MRSYNSQCFKHSHHKFPVIFFPRLLTKSSFKMPKAKETEKAKEKTYTTLSEVGNVLDDLLQRFSTFTTSQDRIIDQNMSSKMDELTVHVEASTKAAFQQLEKHVESSTKEAFQNISQKLDSLKSEIYEEVMKGTKELITPVIKDLQTENMDLKKRVENLEKFQTFNMNKEHMRKLLISSDKFKQKDGKSIETIIKEFLPEIEARYTTR